MLAILGILSSIELAVKAIILATAMHPLRISFISLVVSLSLGLKSQTAYQPMLSDYKEWLVKTCEFGNCLYDYYWLAEDTVLNGFGYKMLDGFHYNRNFLMREDVAQRQVFIWFDDASGFPQDILLYDFGLQVGDSTYVRNPISPLIASQGYYHLDSIVSKTFEQTQRRVFYLSSSDPNVLYPQTFWIEGIGSTALINTPGAVGDTASISTLVCSVENGTKIYSRQANDTCYTNPKLHATEYLRSANEIKIWYGYQEEVLHIAQWPANSSLKLINSLGQIVLTHKPYNASEEIRLTHLKPGLYIVAVQYNQQQIYTLKLLKN